MSNNTQLKELDNQVGVLSLVRGEENGQNVWAYVSFYPSKLEEYEKHIIAGDNISLDHFGIIIEEGIGETPSEDIKQYMEEKYQFDHSFMEK